MIETKKRKRDSHALDWRDINFLAGILRSSKRRKQNKISSQTPKVHYNGDEVNGGFCVGKSAQQKKQSLLRKRFSKHFTKQVMKKKLKKFQDYSLPSRSSDYIRSLDTTLGYFSDEIKTNFLDFSASLDGRLNSESYVNEDETDSFAVMELRHKIDEEVTIRERVTKHISDSPNPIKLLEEANTLLLSNSRILACMKELYTLQSAEPGVDKLLPCKGKLCISNVRLPLMWKRTDHIKNQGDHRRFAVFCLVSVGSEVYSTSLVQNVDRKMTDVVFDDVLVFDEVPHDFKVQLDVFCHVIHDDLSNASAPTKVKKKLSGLSSSIGRRFGKTLSGLTTSDITGNTVFGPKFHLIAKGTLSLTDANSSLETHTLELMRQENTSSGLPLFDHYCCKISVQPSHMTEASLCGYLSIQNTNSDLDEKPSYWCELRETTLDGWTSVERRPHFEPDVSIPIMSDIEMHKQGDKDTVNHHIDIISDGFEYRVSADSEPDTDLWSNSLEQQLLNRKVWNIQKSLNQHVFETPLKRTPMNSTTLNSSKFSSTKHRRQRRFLNYSQLNETLEMLMEDECIDASSTFNGDY